MINAQETDSLINLISTDSISTALVDSTDLADSLILADSAAQKKSDLDAVVYAASKDSLFFDLKTKKMVLYGEGDLKYKSSNLTGGKVDIDFLTTQLYAEGIIDTSDSTGQTLIQTPSLTESEENYTGERLKYNFKTQQGYIYLAKNKKETSYYKGIDVKKVNKDTYFVENGLYTTCEHDPPHTHFEASQMKVMQNDKIIGKWIFMYIGGVPIPIPVPFAVIPNQTGRRSGIIIPTFGTDARRGSYFSNFGYFFALSDYYDLTLAGDYFTRGGYAARARARYAKRYSLRGNLDLSYSNLIYGEDNDPDKQREQNYKIGLRHNQTFNPTTKLDVNLQFQSGDYYRSNSTDYNNILKQDIVSNATLNKRWDNGNNLTINYNRNQNLESGNIRETLPRVSFTNSIFYPFKSAVSSPTDQAWYEAISVNYNGTFENEREKLKGHVSHHGGFYHRASAKSNSRVGYINFSPSINVSSKWYNKYTEQSLEPTDEDEDGKIEYTLVEKEIKAINLVQDYDFNVSASTKLYGMAQPNMLGIEALRHTLEPRLTYTYKPDFSDPKYGYYGAYMDTSGNIKEYDKFKNEVFGGASRGERQNLSFSMSNIFEMKTIKDPTDTTSQQQKVRLLNVSGGVSYNFAADSLKLSDMNISYRTQVGQYLNFSLNTGYTFYDYVDGAKVNKFLASEGRGLFRLTNLSLNLSTNISGDKLAGRDEKSKSESEEAKLAKDDNQQQMATIKDTEEKSMYSKDDPDFSIPWNLGLNYNYSLRKTTPDRVDFSSNIGFNLGFNLTKKWKITTSGSYDFISHEFGAPRISIFRDLECWEMNFSWNPLGTYRGFQFEVRMTAPELQDIKVTKSEGLYTGYRGF